MKFNAETLEAAERAVQRIEEILKESKTWIGWMPSILDYPIELPLVERLPVRKPYSKPKGKGGKKKR